MSFTGISTAFRLLRGQKAAATALQHQQCRTISLYHALVAKTTLGAHDLKNWLAYDFPKPHDVSINISNPSDAKRYDSRPLSQALKTVQPGSFLGVAETLLKKRKTMSKEELKAENIDKLYEIRDIKVPRRDKKKGKGEQIKKSKGGHFKRFFLTPESANSEYFSHVIQTMYKFMTMDNNLAIEVSLSAKTLPQLEQMVKDNPHLHPRAILAGMPKMSGIIIKPKINGEKITWVMQGPMKFATDVALPEKENENEKGTTLDVEPDLVSVPDVSVPEGELRYPADRTAQLDSFREKVKEDLQRSAERGSRPDVVDQMVADERKAVNALKARKWKREQPAPSKAHEWTKQIKEDHWRTKVREKQIARLNDERDPQPFRRNRFGGIEFNKRGMVARDSLSRDKHYETGTLRFEPQIHRDTGPASVSHRPLELESRK